jgi:hypothetical protein
LLIPGIDIGFRSARLRVDSVSHDPEPSNLVGVADLACADAGLARIDPSAGSAGLDATTPDPAGRGERAHGGEDVDRAGRLGVLQTGAYTMGRVRPDSRSTRA